MWFDPYKALAEISDAPPATSATTATSRARVAKVANVATLPRPKPQPAPPNRLVRLNPDAGDLPNGTACDLGLFPRTWTGRVVSLAAWRELTEWERHGPRGRHWNAATGSWESKDGDVS